MITQGKVFTLTAYLLIIAMLLWSVCSSQVKDETAPKESGSPLVFVGVLAVVVLLVLLIIPGSSPPAESPKAQYAAPRPDVQPVRNTQIKVDFKMDFTYTPKQEDSVRILCVPRILERLNYLGQSDGNSFSIPDGEARNLLLSFTINNVGQTGNDRFTASLTMSGWGWGTICSITSGEYPFTNPFNMLNKLTDQAYSWLHEGWRDSQPSNR